MKAMENNLLFIVVLTFSLSPVLFMSRASHAQETGVSYYEGEKYTVTLDNSTILWVEPIPIEEAPLCTAETSSNSLRIAAELIELGADISDLYRKGLLGRSYEAVRYWAQGLSRMELRDEVVWAVLRVSDRELAGYPSSDGADLIDVLTTIEGPRVAILLVEQPEGQVKISWRALPGVDVSRLASTFDGGGHELAAATGWRTGTRQRSWRR